MPAAIGHAGCYESFSTLAMHLISQPVAQPDRTLPQIAVCVERLKLAKRLWRGMAVDGLEFGFELEKPLQPGDVVFQSDRAAYVIEQMPEAVLEISLTIAPSAAAGIGWAIGNLHIELMAEATCLLTPDEKAVRQLLARLNVPFRETQAVFRPGRFVRGATNPTSQADDLGPSHQH
jgi:urease accessory protein